MSSLDWASTSDMPVVGSVKCTYLEVTSPRLYFILVSDTLGHPPTHERILGLQEAIFLQIL
jgi:hypothetical protein